MHSSSGATVPSLEMNLMAELPTDKNTTLNALSGKIFDLQIQGQFHEGLGTQGTHQLHEEQLGNLSQENLLAKYLLLQSHHRRLRDEFRHLKKVKPSPYFIFIRQWLSLF